MVEICWLHMVSFQLDSRDNGRMEWLRGMGSTAPELRKVCEGTAVLEYRLGILVAMSAWI